jgi:hypothetical protein
MVDNKLAEGRQVPFLVKFFEESTQYRLCANIGTAFKFKIELFSFLFFFLF